MKLPQNVIPWVIRRDLAWRRQAQPRPAWFWRRLPGAAKYRGCWLLMDRDTEAHDNAEHLYRYLRDKHPEINAWFVLRRNSKDWAKLSAQGFRLISYGSWQHALALTQCQELVSSQIDHYVVSPPVVWWLRRRPWRFTWLQHGVINYDLSKWINPKPISLMVTSSRPEYEAISGPNTEYVFSPSQVLLSGQPRHDTLLAKAALVPANARNLVVLMPTWRKDLVSGGIGLGNKRQSNSQFWDSPFIGQWTALAQNPKLQELAVNNNLEIAILPHPALGEILQSRPLPGVTYLNYLDNDVQDVLAHAAVVVTDFSSIAFEAALVDRPVVYFQFDKERFFSGTHIGGRGYFEYEDDGFGPVCETVPEVVTAISDIVRNCRVPGPPFDARMAQTMSLRDGQASARIVAAIQNVASRNAAARGGGG
ncbi:MAG: CDP-glycerol glycerophosphotransferase family protein [Cellulomonadaceae bacterium]|jgi:CDP-glycerol glycerophosphotransferase (TagB/SpsB family)|nr:CDP-glycerol glycerophosphotransferase family protein [Cellulomonadaceae bacterium]